MRRDAGLTLVEMLAVLAILGIAAGAAALSLVPAADQGVAGEAGAFARGLTGAADATLAGVPPVAVAVDARGYAIGGRRRDLPPGMRLDGTVASPIASGESAAFDVTLMRGGDTWRVHFDGLRATARPAVRR